MPMTGHGSANCYSKLAYIKQLNGRQVSILCNVYFYQTDLDIFITTALIPANPELYVVSGWPRKLFAEPGWRVEVTAGTGGAQPLPSQMGFVV